MKPIPLSLNVLRRAISQGRYRRGCGIAGHGWENRRTDDEKIRDVVGLAVAVDYGVLGIAGHTCPAALPSRRRPWKLRPDLAGAGFTQDPLANVG